MPRRSTLLLILLSILMLHGCEDTSSVANNTDDTHTASSSGADTSSDADMASSSGGDASSSSGADTSSSGADTSSSGADTSSSGADTSSDADTSSSGADTSSDADMTSTNANGADCTDGAECTSTICAPLADASGSVCSECSGNADCNGDTCVYNDTDGFFICEATTLAALGEDCNDAADCEADACFQRAIGGGVCSLCESNNDCGAASCAYDFIAGDPYARCVGDGVLGDACAAGPECASGFCANDVCSECAADNDCGVGGSCLDDATAGYMTCLDGAGSPCDVATPDTCASGLCSTPPVGNTGVCTECNETADCDPGQICDPPDFLGGRLYGECVGSKDLGEACGGDGECSSSHCNTGVCSDCSVANDCGDGGSCIDDTATSGYFICLGGLGQGCGAGEECASGFCFSNPIGGGSCSECLESTDCGANEICDPPQLLGGLNYAVCVGESPNGTACTSDAQCTSGVCNNDVCSDCRDDADCPAGGLGGGNGVCDDQTGGALGYHVCLFNLGQPCDGPDNCTSGNCFDSGFGASICSECDDTAQDCGNGQTCSISFQLFYAVCQ